MMHHDAACCIENNVEIKSVLISALCDARQHALTRVDVQYVNGPLDQRAVEVRCEVTVLS